MESDEKDLNLFFCTQWDERQVLLEDEEARHCTQVFRHRPGDHILVTDGCGYKIRAQIIESKKSQVSCSTERVENVGSKRPYQLELVVAPTKKIQRTEWIVEKSIEWGIDAIHFVLTHHSERRKLRMDRIEKIARAALKQSRQYQLPKLTELTEFQDYLEQAREKEVPSHILFQSKDAESLPELARARTHTRWMIGPEGDFSEEEIQTALQYGWVPATLGDRRLRTETAALTVPAFFHLLHLSNR